MPPRSVTGAGSPDAPVRTGADENAPQRIACHPETAPRPESSPESPARISDRRPGSLASGLIVVTMQSRAQARSTSRRRQRPQARSPSLPQASEADPHASVRVLPGDGDPPAPPSAAGQASVDDPGRMQNNPLRAIAVRKSTLTQTIRNGGSACVLFAFSHHSASCCRAAAVRTRPRRRRPSRRCHYRPLASQRPPPEHHQQQGE
jgi:hypothetical protein